MPKPKTHDRSYVDNQKHFMDPKCKHPDTVIFDGEFYPKKEGGQQKRVQVICTQCGKIGKWSKMVYSPTGAFDPYYVPRI